MKLKSLIFCIGVAGLLMFIVNKAGQGDRPVQIPSVVPDEAGLDASVNRINQWLRNHWAEDDIEPAGQADDLTILRRLSLALHGTIPSLQEIAAFEADRSPDRIRRWTVKLLQDPRFADYFAERIERVLVGVDEGNLIFFRRDRLRNWLANRLRDDRPWQETVTALIAGSGLSTNKPQTNFITSAFTDEEGIDVNRVTGRTVRAFLGQRLDCAQCHDDFFDKWTQQNFEGLAAFYGQARITGGGLVDWKSQDKEPIEYTIIRPGREEEETIEPKFPFHPEWSSGEGSRREQLASWIVHPDNKRFERAISNRIWGLMFGRAFFDPVDGIGHPEDGEESDLLDLLGQEFRSHNGSLKYLIRVIAESDVFRLKSEVDWADEDLYREMSFKWAVFPLVRLRPEQMIGAMYQASSVRTVDRNSNMFIRFSRFFSENDFLKRYGDADDDELLQQSGTIPQALIRMNGKFTREFIKPELLNTARRILEHSPDDETLIQNSFLATLTRRPDSEERQYFANLLQQVQQKADGQSEKQQNREREFAVEDLFWTLFNSPGFSWNH